MNQNFKVFQQHPCQEGVTKKVLKMAKGLNQKMCLMYVYKKVHWGL